MILSIYIVEKIYAIKVGVIFQGEGTVKEHSVEQSSLVLLGQKAMRGCGAIKWKRYVKSLGISHHAGRGKAWQEHLKKGDRRESGVGKSRQPGRVLGTREKYTYVWPESDRGKKAEVVRGRRGDLPIRGVSTATARVRDGRQTAGCTSAAKSE